MANATSAADIELRFLEGKGFCIPCRASQSSGGLTTATAGSGHFTNSLNSNAVGTTHPGTLVGFPLPPTTDEIKLFSIEGMSSASESAWLGYYYKIGSANLTSTSGNRLTHDGTFTRLRRTRFGTANTPINMIPLIYVTTAASTTQCSYTFDYVDQDGNSVTSPTNQLPAATTAVQGLYNMILDNADTSILDITAVTVSTATTNGVVSVYGFEPLAKVVAFGNTLSYENHLYGPMKLVDMIPASPDSGSVTSLLALMCPTNLATGTEIFVIKGFNNA